MLLSAVAAKQRFVSNHHPKVLIIQMVIKRAKQKGISFGCTCCLYFIFPLSMS